MKKYEIWGSDDNGKHGLLAFANVDVPVAGDTILVRGQVREIDRVWRHHAGAQPVLRIKVAEAAEGAGGD